MDYRSALRPRRSLAFPFVVLLYPLLWVVVRTFNITAVGYPITANLSDVLALTIGAVVVSYLGAAVGVTALSIDVASVPVWARSLVSPSNATLGVVTVISVALAAYISAASVIALPHWVDTAARIGGIVLGWPLMLVILGTYAIGNSLPALQSQFAVQFVVALVGVTLSAAWVFILATWLTSFTPANETGKQLLSHR